MMMKYRVLMIDIGVFGFIFCLENNWCILLNFSLMIGLFGFFMFLLIFWSFCCLYFRVCLVYEKVGFLVMDVW